MLQPILVGLASSITMQSLGKIVLRAPAVGAKYGVCLPAGLREAQATGTKFTRRPKKNRFFAPLRLVAPIHLKRGRLNGHVGPLGCAKFHLNRCSWLEIRPQNMKNFHFLA